MDKLDKTIDRPVPPFRDRQHVGQLLADAMLDLNYENPVVLALPRGGVPVATVIAEALNAPLEVIIARKIGVPGHVELAVGAVVDGTPPQIVINEDIRLAYGVSDNTLQAGVDKAKAEIDNRRSRYTPGRIPVSLNGKTAIIVDDGIATGATARAALLAAIQAKPAHLILAVGVASTVVLDELKNKVDEIVCLHKAKVLHSVGRFYEDFSQISDQAVVDMLREANLSS